MKRDYRLSLKDIIDACGHIRAFVQGMDEDAFVLIEESFPVKEISVESAREKNIPMNPSYGIRS